MVSLWYLTGAVALTALVGELLHARRCRRIAHLAFGPSGKPRAWARSAPVLRVLAVTLLAWGLTVLFQTNSSLDEDSSEANRAAPVRHLVLALDVSPSMGITDAGTNGVTARADRARAILRSALERLGQPGLRISVIAFYSSSRPVVTDTRDREVVDNILRDLPLTFAFDRGKTKLHEAITSAAAIAKDWQPDSASLILVSDGDTIPADVTPSLPRAYQGALVVGVGNSARPTLIDGHSSRQDASSLRRLAGLIGGRYHDGNVRHLPTSDLHALGVASAAAQSADLTTVALAAVLAGAAIIALLPYLLITAGVRSHPRLIGASHA